VKGVQDSTFMEGNGPISYALIVLIQFWLQPVPYADLSGDGRVDLSDYVIIYRIQQGDIWVAKFKWLCENRYADGSTELVEGWTYTIWETEPVKRDLHPEIPGFNWTDQWTQSPLAEMNYIFFENMFPHLIIEDANESLYEELSAQMAPAPSIAEWEIASRHGGDIGEVWLAMEDGYVEPRINGIEKLRIWFDQPMNPDSNDPNMILVTSERDESELHPCSVEWEEWDCVVITFCSALPDEDTYRIRIDAPLWSSRGQLLNEIGEICVTALKGDVDADLSVTTGDILAVQAHSGEPVDLNNARFDISGNAAINVHDMRFVGGYLGHTSPSCQP
jgi:hypothetical protein